MKNLKLVFLILSICCSLSAEARPELLWPEIRPCVEKIQLTGFVEGNWNGKQQKHPFGLMFCGWMMSDSPETSGHALVAWPRAQINSTVKGKIDPLAPLGKPAVYLKEPVGAGNGVFTGIKVRNGFSGIYTYYQLHLGIKTYRWQVTHPALQ